MRVAVTGGSGFVGCHSVRALLDAGHELRLSVRSRHRLEDALVPLGVDPGDRRIEVVEGDVTDAVHVEEALRGCDAVLHAASMYTFDLRKARELQRTNQVGTETVLGTAARFGLDPIVYVSSTVALAGRRDGETLSPEQQPGPGRGMYSRSKVDSERTARRLQSQGATVVITYPGPVSGPYDPRVGETARAYRNVLRGLYTFAVGGGAAFCDIRDVARVHASVMRPGLGPRRYMIPSNYRSLSEMFETARSLTGRRLPLVELPLPALTPMLSLADLMQRWAPGELPVNSELVRYISYGHPVDSSRTEGELGVTAMSFEQSVRDTLIWMVQAGHLNPRLAGRLAKAAVARP